MASSLVVAVGLNHIVPKARLSRTPDLVRSLSISEASYGAGATLKPTRRQGPMANES